MKEFIIEAQTIPAKERHSFIFTSFDNLDNGDCLLIVNTHDPVPLLNQFKEYRADQFEYEYVEQGPKEWRLRLIKRIKGCCGCCGA